MTCSSITREGEPQGPEIPGWRRSAVAISRRELRGRDHPSSNCCFGLESTVHIYMLHPAHARSTLAPGYGIYGFCFEVPIYLPMFEKGVAWSWNMSPQPRLR